MGTNGQLSLPVRKRPRGRPFAKGNGGRKVGSRNRATLLADAMPEGEREELVRKGIELARPVILRCSSSFWIGFCQKNGL
jgi:hypothetical protein